MTEAEPAKVEAEPPKAVIPPKPPVDIELTGENVTECTGGEQLPDGLAHPVALFHMPILGAGTSIAAVANP